MLNLIILVVAVCILIGILKAVLNAVGEVILGIVGIAVIVAAIVFLGPILLKLLSYLPKLIPWILIILAALIVLGCAVTLVEKRRYRPQLDRLDHLGIDRMDSALEDWKKMSELGLVETTSTGYAISISFYKRVISKIGQAPTLTVEEFEQDCATCADCFQAAFSSPLLEFLQRKALLFEFPLYNGETILVSKPFMKSCEDLFLKEGAATEDEFAQMCGRAGLLRVFPQDGRQFVSFFLAHMLSCGKVKKVALDELGDFLYVAENQRQDSNMVRREINLD